MDAKRFLEALSVEELQEVHVALPAEFERRNLATPTGSIALEGATRTDAETTPTDTPETPTPEAPTITSESLLATLDTALTTYGSLLDVANGERAKVKGRKKPEQLEVVDQDAIRVEVEALVANPTILAELQTEIDYFTANAEADSPTPGFDVVVIPEGLTPTDNEAVASSLQARIQEGLGTNYDTPYIRPEAYNDKRAQQTTGKGYRIAFAPRHYNVPNGTAANQKEWLKNQNHYYRDTTELQTATDAEALSQINNLLAGNELPKGAGYDADRFHRTYFRRFDQAPVGGCVSCVCVDDVGGLNLGESSVHDGNPTRALVVPKLKA